MSRTYFTITSYGPKKLLQKEYPVLLQLQKTLHNQQVTFLNGNEETADLIRCSLLSQMAERGLEDIKTQAFKIVKHTEYDNQELLKSVQDPILNE